MFDSANQSLSLLLSRHTTWNVYNSLTKYDFQNVNQYSVNQPKHHISILILFLFFFFGIRQGNFLTNGALKNMSTSSFMCSVLEIYILPAWWLHCLTHVIPLYTYLASLYDDGESANISPSKDVSWGRGRAYTLKGAGMDVCVCIISERARSSGRCRDCPHWLRSPSSGAAMRCQRTLTAATSPFSHSPVLSLELLPPAGRLSLFSTSSSCSGTTPSPMGGRRGE